MDKNLWEIIGYRKNGQPIYLIQGGAPEEGEGDDGAAEGDSDDSADSGTKDDGPVTFDSRDDFVAAVNKIVKQRVARIEKKYAPVVAERDTLKTKVDEWQPLVEGKQSDDQKREAAYQAQQKQIEDLLNYKSSTEREKLVRRIAKDKGLPEEFIPRIQGDDEDSITDDIDSFVALLPEKPAGTKVSKDTKPGTKDEGKGGKKGTGAAGGADDDEAIDPVKLANSIGRYGSSPYIVGMSRTS